MALKDWEQNTAPIKGNYLFINKKNKEYRISLFRNYPKKSFKATIFINFRDKEKERIFNTQSQALKFAKRYMRTH